MHVDPGMVMPQSVISEGANDIQMQQGMGDKALGNGQMHNFNHLVNQINPNQALMDPTTLSLMKAQNPDGNLAASVMKSVKWIRKEVDGSLNDLQSKVAEIEGKPNDQVNMAELLEMQMQTGVFTFTMSLTTNLVNKSTQHLDTLIKAQ